MNRHARPVEGQTDGHALAVAKLDIADE